MKVALSFPRTGLLTLSFLLVMAQMGCATWHTLEPAKWERAGDHKDVFRTRLRVRQLDGQEIYLELPEWSATEVRGVYPIGWPRSPSQDTLIVIPRDSIASVAQLESNRGLSVAYIAAAMAIGVFAGTR